MSDTVDTARRAPTVFVAHEEAHFELCKLRAYLRLLIQIVDPESIGLKATTLHPQAFSWLLTNIWKGVDEYLQATYWSAEHAIDIEEAHKRIAAIRERNEELRGIAAT
jgi:hypothetical protein